VFVKGADQKAAADVAKAEASKALGAKIATRIVNAGAFYPADGYHQDYYKQSKIIVTRFGPRKKSTAYKLYREACGRDARVRQLWGSQAAFAQ
jgi:peptide-methionine (S)-S-oxide reductase